MNHSKRDQALLDERATDELLMPKDVAMLFGVHRSTLKKWAKTGKLRDVEITSGHRRYWRSDVDRLLAERGLYAFPVVTGASASTRMARSQHEVFDVDRPADTLGCPPGCR